MMWSTWLKDAVLTAFSFCSLSTGQAVLIYWNLFNIESENSIDVAYVTYATLADMLTDSNRTGQSYPNVIGKAVNNVVGSGASVM